jgi:small subunit ribosomal protein S20
MPIIQSAIKRMRQEKTRRARNAITKKNYKFLMKEFETLISEKKIEQAAKLYPQVQKSIDFATKKNILHKNNAARKKSRLAKMIGTTNVSGVKASTSTTKKASPKKTTSQKSSSKKTEKK